MTLEVRVRSRRRWWQEIRRHWFIYLVGIVVPLIAYVVFIGYPIIESIRLSFLSWDGLGAKEFVGLAQYKKLVQDDNFTRSLINNLKWAIVTLIFPVVGGLLLAVVFNSKRMFFGGTFRALLFLPSTMSLASIGLMFAVIMNPVFGGLNEALRAVGLGALTQQWLANPDLVMYSLICVFSWSYIGISMMLFHAGISQIDPELFEMATLEGANFLQTLWMVTLPMLRPVMTVVVTLTVISSLKAFDLVLLMTKGGPYKMSNVLGYFMYTESFHKYRFGYGAAISVVILLLSSAFAVVYLRSIAKGALHAE